MDYEETRPRERTKRIYRLLAALLVLGIIFIGGIYFNFSGDTIKAKGAYIAVNKGLSPVEIVIPEMQSASILSAGDIILHSPFIDSRVYRGSDGNYDYSSMFRYITEDYQNADFTVVNLETTISDGNYCGYPTFRSPAAIVDALMQSQADLCLLANNHIYDNGSKGLHMTMDSVADYKLLYTGTRKSAESKTYTIQDINGIKVGILNYVYASNIGNGQKAINGNPVNVENSPLINTFTYDDLESFYGEIEKSLADMTAEGAEYTIVYLHWGNEYQTSENSTQRNIASRLCELGIDALIGGHPHVVQPVDLLTNADDTHQMICIYSMGNHISNQRIELMETMPTGHTEDGLMVKLSLMKLEGGLVSLSDVDFIPTWVYKTLENGGAEYYVLPLDDPEGIIKEASELNISADVEQSLKRTNEIIGSGAEKIQSALPITNNH